MQEESLQVLNQERKEELWAERIRQCRESGLGVQAWCAEQGLSHHTYYKWQQKLYHKYRERYAGTENCFYEISTGKNRGQPAATVHIGTIRADIYGGADEQTVRNVLRALKTC